MAADRGLVLRPLRLADRAGATRAQRLLAADDFGFLPNWDESVDWAEYVGFLDAIARGERLPTGWVPTTYLVGEDDGTLVGRIGLRHALTEDLLQWGGHVGYAVLPEQRRRGYATAMLRAVLPRARVLGLPRVLVICDDSNAASVGVIEACGGVLEDRRPRPGTAALKRRYWVATDEAVGDDDARRTDGP